MSTPSAEIRRARVAAEAAEWIHKLDFERLSDGERREFVDWLLDSPLHVAEMLRAGRLSAALADYNRWLPEASAGALTADNVVPFTRLNLSNTAVEHPRGSGRTLRIAGVAAALALITVAGLFVGRQFSSTQIQTRADERREVMLEDGSVIRLSPNTDLRVDMQARLRSVMLSHGEAVFRVAKDSARPFVVSAARARVQAVGTVFAVARSADAVVVTVAEGRVTVSPFAETRRRNTGQEVTQIALQANERISISASGIASEVHRIENARTPEWDDTQLVFENLRVADVVARFNSHNRLQIRIVDDALTSRIVSGIFDVNDPRSFADFLTTVAGATSVQNGPSEIVIARGAAGAGPAAPVH